MPGSRHNPRVMSHFDRVGFLEASLASSRFAIAS
jgi:hypothetical protein